MTMTAKKRGETELVITRQFGAAPDRVYAAHTDPTLIRQWMTGPEEWRMTECESDAVPGGRMRYTWTDEGGRSFTMTGTYVELEPPHRMVHTEAWDDGEMPETVVTTTFEPRDGGTWMTLLIVYPSAEAREDALATGMTDGMEMSYARIDGLSAAA